MAVGIEAVVSGPVVKLVDFTPDDDKTKRFVSFDLGYMGGSIKVNCTPEHYRQCKDLAPGSTVKASVTITAKGKEARFECLQLKAA